MLFGGLPYDAERNKIENLDSKTLASMADYVADKLNPSQAEYFKLALRSSVSVAKGPPGVGLVYLSTFVLFINHFADWRIASDCSAHILYDFPIHD